MISIGRKATAFLLAGGAALVLAQPAGATSNREQGENTSGSGTFQELSFVAAPTQTVIGNTLYVSQAVRGQYHGTVSGAYTEAVVIAINLGDGTLHFSGVQAFRGKVGHRKGSFVGHLEGTGQAGPSGIVAQGRLTIISGRGGLKKLHAVEELSATIGASHLAVGTYTIDYHFGSGSD